MKVLGELLAWRQPKPEFEDVPHMVLREKSWELLEATKVRYLKQFPDAFFTPILRVNDNHVSVKWAHSYIGWYICHAYHGMERR